MFRNASSLWCSKKRDTVSNALSFVLRRKMMRNTLLDKVSRNKSFMFRHRFSFLRRYKYSSAIFSSLYAKMRHSLLYRLRMSSSNGDKVIVSKDARNLARVHRINDTLFLRDIDVSASMRGRRKVGLKTRLSAIFPITVEGALARRRAYVTQLVRALNFRGMIGSAFRRHMSILYSDAESKKTAMLNCAVTNTGRYMHFKSIYEMSLLNIKAMLHLRSKLLKVCSSDSRN